MNEENKTSTAAPVIADLGRRSRKQIGDLKKGYGKLMDEIQDCVQELVTSGTVAEGAQPVVILVSERPSPPSSMPKFPSPNMFFPSWGEVQEDLDDEFGNEDC